MKPITRKHPTKPYLIEYRIDKIHDEEIWLCFESKQDYINYLKLMKLFSFRIKEAIDKIRKEVIEMGIKPNEKAIKKIIYDKWGRNGLDNHGNPI